MLLKEQLKVFAHQNKFNLDLSHSQSKKPSERNKSKKVSPTKSPSLSANKSTNLKSKRTFFIKQGDDHSP